MAGPTCLVYSLLGVRSRRRGTPARAAEPGHDFVADAAFLKMVLAGGGSASVRVAGAWAAEVDAVAHVTGVPGSEVFLEVSETSSGASDVAFGSVIAV